tara:strand:- start:342 stop:536 length:195 start_codon:yes stop_codon:yes gene_type:complete
MNENKIRISKDEREDIFNNSLQCKECQKIFDSIHRDTVGLYLDATNENLISLEHIVDNESVDLI